MEHNYYTVWDRRNALLPRKVNMMMILQQFDKNIERLNKFKQSNIKKILKKLLKVFKLFDYL